MKSPLSGLGLQLQLAREALGSRSPKSPPRPRSHQALEATERERFDLVPGGIFRRTYVRACAQAVGLDGATCVRVYVEHFEAMAPTGGRDSADWLRPGLAIVMVTVLAAILSLAAVALA